MKIKSKHIESGIAFLFLLPLCFSHKAFGQGTAFTYQGRLNNAGSPASGSYDFTFTLFATNGGGAALAGPVTNAATAVTNGLFTTLVNLGPVFTGSSNWLEIAVRTNGTGSFNTLSPRDLVTPTPYAMSAESLSGGISAAQLTSGIISTNVLAGFQGPFFSTVNAGSGNVNYGQYDVVAGGLDNDVQSAYGVVGGGNNNAAGYYATVGGGANNNASGEFATVPGGYLNTASGNYSFAAGYSALAVNTGAFVWADIQGGYQSTNDNSFNVRAGGGANFVTGGAGINLDGAPVLTTSSAALGIVLQQNGSEAVNVIEGASDNDVAPGVIGAAISGGINNTIFGDVDNYGSSAIGGGADNFISRDSPYTVIGGGYNNAVYGQGGVFGSSVLGGGYHNTIYSNSQYSVIGGGTGNSVAADSGFATVGGGSGNQAGGPFATVPGGLDNVASGYASFAAGYGAQTAQSGTLVWSDAEGSPFTATGPNQFLVRAAGGVGVGTNAPRASVDIVSANGAGTPQLRLVQLNGTDFSRLRYQTGTALNWDVAAGGAGEVMNWYLPNYGNVMSLATNGALTTGGLTVNNNAPIQVAGTGINSKTAVFTQQATSSNLGTYAVPDQATIIDNPLCNGNPNAIIFVTPYNGTQEVAAGYGFGPNSNQWAIFTITDDSINVGETWNVMIVLP